MMLYVYLHPLNAIHSSILLYFFKFLDLCLRIAIIITPLHVSSWSQYHQAHAESGSSGLGFSCYLCTIPMTSFLQVEVDV